MIYHKCYKILGDEQDALEAMQEVSMRIAENLKDFAKLKSPTAWIYRVTTNTCLNQLRHRKRRRLSTWEDAELAVAPESVSPEDRLDLQAILADLDDNLRQVLVLRCALGLSHADIAEVMNRSRMTINRWFRKIDQLVGKKYGQAATLNA